MGTLIRGKQLIDGEITEAKLASALELTLIRTDGSATWSADQPAGGNKITGLASPTVSGDAATKGYVDSAIAGLNWQAPVAVDNYIGNATIATLNGLSPAAGDAYVATDAGTPTAGTSDALVAGSLAEFDGTSWKEIVAGSGGFVASGTRAIASTATALISPLTDATDDGKIVEWDGTSLTPDLATGQAVDGAAVLVNGDLAYNENKSYVFDGTVPTGSWIQFGGTGTGLNSVDGTITTIAPDDTAAAGSDSSAARADHTHAIVAAAPSGGIAAADAEGVATSFARSDHAHALDERQEEIATEAITGTDTALTATLTVAPINALGLKLYLNGILQQQGAGEDYTLSGSTITWLALSGTAVDMDTTDTLIAVYVTT